MTRSAISMLPHALIILDLETTGVAAARERITEIGLLEVANGEIVGSWSQLVNPERSIPPFIQSLTGISDEMVQDAPRFEQLARGLFDRLDRKLLVAHNARFDYGFLKSEFARAGLSYRSRVLCTARLSRKLFPEHRRHNLDSLIERHGLRCSARHRALGDAEVLWQFLQKLYAQADPARIDAAVQAQMVLPSLPAGLSAEVLEAIPEAPGAYVFFDAQGAPLYVGKNVDLHARVCSHFAGERRPARDRRMAQQVARVEWIETAGELGALLCQSRLTKELLPRQREHRTACGDNELARNQALAPWPYKGAIGLRERSREKSEIHLFEHWCFLGTACSDSEIYDRLERRGQAVFDRHIYQILKRELAQHTRGVALIEFGPMCTLWHRGAEAPMPG